MRRCLGVLGFVGLLGFLLSCQGGEACPEGSSCEEKPLVCEAEQVSCAGSCVDLQTDPRHCGLCGSTCPNDSSCDKGRCLCRDGASLCAGSCVSLASDPRHCGGCGQACKAGDFCVKGQCRLSCPASAPDICGQRCVDLQRTPEDCGACGQRCATYQECIGGLCLCPLGLTLCQGRCVDLLATASDCGICGQACPTGSFCSQGQCIQECPKATPTVCLGGCVDLQTSKEHCGRCGERCGGASVCIEGRCQCPIGRSDCGEGCIDLASSSEHCGACNQICAENQVCVGGFCVPNCPKETPTACYGGCFDLRQSNEHCGRCGLFCRPGQTCSESECLCTPGLTRCLGLCTDLERDPAHCGQCGKVCDPGLVCVSGVCKASCPSETPSICQGGCYDLQSDDKNCGVCGRQCPVSWVCDQGQCVRKCPAGEVLCRGRCLIPAQTKEICNGLDDNCDGSVDEGLEEPCYSGPRETRGVGSCKDGIRTCQKGGWGPCQGQITPLSQDACGDSSDNDCDGSVDEGCACKVGESRPCYDGPQATKGIGECKDGIQTCSGGIWARCEGSQDPKEEACDGKDNDCDGKTDEAFQEQGRGCVLPAQTAECSQGALVCRQGQILCERTQAPQPEICDGKDNDCDGQIDNGLQPKPCYTGPQGSEGKGGCKGGFQTCLLGSYGPCLGEVLPEPEICDGKDNDCDGKTDEGIAGDALRRDCYTYPVGCTQNLGVFSCLGECRPGTQTCTQGTWSSCDQQTPPQPEVCDGKDNDCDGLTDEALTSIPCPKQQGKCNGSQLPASACIGGQVRPCTATEYRAVFPGYQEHDRTCDGQDDDCDGLVDEDAPNCVSTFAGGNSVAGIKDGQGRQAEFSSPWGMTSDPQGNLYVVDSFKIRKVDPKGMVTTWAGADKGFQDGYRTSARFDRIHEIHRDPQGRFFVYEPDTQRIRIIDTQGQVTTQEAIGYLVGVDGEGKLWQWYETNLGSASRVLLRVSLDGKPEILGWRRGTVTQADGPLFLLPFFSLGELIFDPSREVLIHFYGDSLNNNGFLRRIDHAQGSDGYLSTFVGPNCSPLAQPCQPGSIPGADSPSLTETGEFYFFGYYGDNRISKIDRKGQNTLLYQGQDGYTDGPLSLSRFSWLRTIIAGQDGKFYASDAGNKAIRVIRFQGRDVCTTPGASRPCYTGEAGTQGVGPCKAGTQVCQSDGLWGLCTGEVLPKPEICNGIDDDCNGQIDDQIVPRFCPKQRGLCSGSKPRCVQGILLPCAASDYQAVFPGYKSDDATCDGKDDDCDGKIDEDAVGPCLRTLASDTDSFTLDPQGGLYVFRGAQILSLRPGQPLLPLAGSIRTGYAEGVGWAARFQGPGSLFFHGSDLYTTESHRLRKITPAGQTSLVAGTGEGNFLDGPALQAKFSFPRGLFFTPSGEVLIADTHTHRVRKLGTNGQVTTLAGTGTSGFQDGSASQARFAYPYAITSGSNGDLYIADSGNHRIRRLDTSGQVTTFLGDGLCRYASGGYVDCHRDGPRTQAQIQAPTDITRDPAGNLYIVEPNAYRIRKVDASGQVTTFLSPTQGLPNGTLLSKVTAILFAADSSFYLLDDQTLLHYRP